MNQTDHSTGNFHKGRYLGLGLALRLILAPFLGHPFDSRIFMAVGMAVSKGITPYGQYVLQDMFAAMPHPHLFGIFPGIGYPPLWGLIIGDMYTLSSAIAPNNLIAYNFALKIPIIVAELITALLVYDIVKRLADESTASKAFLLFVFCPFIIAVGTVWGMFDVLALFFVLLSAYTLESNWKLSSVYLSVASVLKVFPFLLAPLFSLLVFKSIRNRGQALRNALLFLLLTVVLVGLLTFVPMILFNWPLSNMYNALGYQAGVAATPYPYDTLIHFPYGAASPFNVFAFLSRVTNGLVQPPLIFVYMWVPACVAVYMILWRTRKVKADFVSALQWSLLLLLVFFTTRVWVSEQNLVFLFGFLALSVFLQAPEWQGKLRLVWILLFSFVLVHVPAISFLWLPYPWTLNVASIFCDGPLGWTRLLSMTLLTFSAFALSWFYVAGRLRWRV